LIVDADLKLAARRRDESDALDLWLEILYQVSHQAHGPVGVVSNSAIFDLYFHYYITPVLKIILRLGYRHE
jgi:hypothetical protein